MNQITASLGEITTVLSGTTPQSSNPIYWNGSHTWVTPTDLGQQRDHVISTSARMITDEGLLSCNLQPIPKGAVVMSSRAPIGHLAIAGSSLYTNQGCKSFVCSNSIDPWFLYFKLQHQMPNIQALGSGATFLEVSKTALEGFKISFPQDVDVQRHIAASLQKQLAEVETARHAAVLQAKDIILLRSRLLNEIFTSLSDIPCKVLGEHARTTSGSTPPRGNKRYWEPAEIPWVKTGEVAFAPISHTEEAISKTALNECSLTLLPANTVLVAMYGQGKTRGQSAILKVPATTNQACFAVMPNDTWEPEFLYYWLVANYQSLRDLSEDRGGNQANLNGALLKALEIPAPNRTLQLEMIGRIKTALQEVDALATSSKTMLDELDLLPQRLLAQAFEPQVNDHA